MSRSNRRWLCCKTSFFCGRAYKSLCNYSLLNIAHTHTHAYYIYIYKCTHSSSFQGWLDCSSKSIPYQNHKGIIGSFVINHVYLFLTSGMYSSQTSPSPLIMPYQTYHSPGVAHATSPSNIPIHSQPPLLTTFAFALPRDASF